MIETITTSAIFPTSGALSAQTFQPKTGITAVVGENGVGKTFRSIEAVRWLLFGKAALRGSAGDYKEARVSGIFVIRGARYEVHRGKGGELITNCGSGDILARGAEKVTEKVIELLGYDLDVFDLCNAATQGNVQALGALRPAARKAIIDKVLRLTDAEAAEKFCRDESRSLKRDAEAMAKTLRAPGIKPVTPHNTDSGSLRAQLAGARNLRDQFVALRARRRDVEPPVMPAIGAFNEAAIAELEVYVDEQRELHRQHRDLTVASQQNDLTAEQLDAAEARRQAKNLVDSRGPAPAHGAEEKILEGWRAWSLYDAHTASEPVTCPECAHVFRPTGEAPQRPELTKEWLRDQEQRVRAWAGADPNEPLPQGLDLNAQAIAHGRSALRAREALAKLEPLGPDRRGELNTMRQDKAALEAFSRAQLQFERIRQANDEVDTMLALLGDEPTQAYLDDFADRLRATEVYEAELAAWQRDDVAFKDTQAKIEEALRLAEEYRLGAVGVADARAVIKALIAPKISRIASTLIRDMSAGKLTDVVVDEDMEITVNGQRIETLSGAGITVANLALRIAMGQALIGRVFPVFLADEIDGDLSVSRREATLQAMVSLKKHLLQIILVTHRGADVADQVWHIETTG